MAAKEFTVPVVPPATIPGDDRRPHNSAFDDSDVTAIEVALITLLAILAAARGGAR